MRMEPPWSPPMAMSTAPAATSAPLPLDEPRIVRIAHRTAVARVAAAGEAQALTDGFTQNGPARVEDARHDRRVTARHVAFQHAGPVHHGHAGDADVVLDGEGLARERAGRGAGDVRTPV